MKVRPGRVKYSIFVGFTVLLVVASLEAILTLLSCGSERIQAVLAEFTPNQFPPLPDERLGHRPNPDHPDHDSRGFRNRSVPERAVIVALGDSQTYGTGVAREQAWPQQLQELLGRETYNLAYGGYGPAHSLLLLDEAMAMQPEIVIEALYAGNDLFDCYWLVYEGNQLPGFVATDPSVIRSVELREQESPLRQEFDGLFLARHGSSVRGLLAGYSKIWALGRAVDRAIRESSASYQWAGLRRKARASNGRLQIVESAGCRTVLMPRYRHSALNLDDPRVREGQRIALEAIREMQRRVSEGNAHLLVLLVPTKELVFESLTDSGSGDPGDVYRELIRDEQEHWRQTRAFLEEHQIDFVDALPALRNVLGEGNQPYPITSDGHPNPEGHRVLAELLESTLRSRGWLAADGDRQ